MKILQRNTQFRLYSLQAQSMSIGTFHCSKKRIKSLEFHSLPSSDSDPRMKSQFQI